MKLKSLCVLIAGLALTPAASAFNSGSTGADGAFNPTATTQVQLPPSGIFNFTTVNIPAGVTITFIRNAANTPVVILASGDVTIAGVISVNGGPSAHTGAAGDGNLADDGTPGLGGPGGYDGGTGGLVGSNRRGGSGVGPGGGAGGDFFSGFGPGGGGGGGFTDAGSNAVFNSIPSKIGTGGVAYGAHTSLPLLGGSGGGGGAGGTSFRGAGGGGGAGALLIASSGTVNVTGTIQANGGSAGNALGSGFGGGGGGGSAGAIRIVATTIAGNGAITAIGGSLGNAFNSSGSGGNGSAGRIRLEAENITRTAGTNPGNTFSAPGSLFVSGLPTLAITSVAGVNVTVGTDVTLPSDTPNPVAVTFATTNVPTGNAITLIVTPANAAAITATSTALSGTLESATASASFTLPTGTSVLLAKVGYTVTAAMGQELSRFAQGERVERVELSANTKGESFTTLITVSGKKFILPAKLAGIAG